MKVLVTSTGKTLDASLDARFGRAKFFAVVETESADFEIVHNNAAREASQGAGIQAAELAAQLGVKTVITGHCGPKAFAALKAAGIEVVSGASGTVRQAVEAFKTGVLKSSSAADVSGHWA
jgi:predicted Fe-Mo cluster-binding NifX family protein